VNTVSHVSHVLVAYETEDNGKMVDEIPLPGISLPELRRIFAQPDDEPMVDCFPVSPREAAALQPRVSVVLQLDRFDYFVEPASPNPLPTRQSRADSGTSATSSARNRP